MKAKDTRTVLHIAPTPFFSNRGCHIRIKNIIDALATQNIDAIVCSYHLGDTPEGMDVRRIKSIPGYTKRGVGFSPYKFPADIMLFALCLTVVWKERPKLLYGHLHEGGMIGWALKAVFFLRPMELVMDMQGSLTGELKAYGTFDRFPAVLRVFHWLESMICKMPKMITCSSVASRQLLIDEFRLKENVSIYLPDVVGQEFFSLTNGLDLKKELNISPDQKIVIYSGSLLQGKGVDVLYDAMKLVCHRRHDCHFLLVGYPVEGAKIFVDRNALGERCTLTGEVEYSQLKDFLAIGDIALDPKEQESGEASGKILHYMAAGLPVICFDFPNNRFLLEEYGYYAESVDCNGLAFKIEQALNQLDLARQRGIALRDLAKGKFSVGGSGQLLQDQVMGKF